jgi:hypothetical protein
LVDETERYRQALLRLAIEQKKAEQGDSKKDDSAAYEEALKKMAVSQREHEDSVKSDAEAADIFQKKLRELNETQNEGSSIVEKLHQNNRILYKLFNMMPEPIARIGHSIISLSKGPVGAIIAVVGAFLILKKKIDEVKKSNEEAAASMVALWEAQQSSFSTAKHMAADYLVQLQSNHQTILDNLNVQMEREQAVLTQQLENEKRLQAARMESEILKAGDDKTKADEIRFRYKLSEEMSGISTEEGKLQRLKKYQEAQSQLKGSYGGQMKTAQEGQAEFNLADAGFSDITASKIKKLDEQIKKGSAKQGVTEGDQNSLNMFYGRVARGDKNATELWELMKKRKALTEELADRKKAGDDWTKAVSNATEKYNAANSALQSITDKIESMSWVLSEKKSGSAAGISAEIKNEIERVAIAARKKMAGKDSGSIFSSGTNAIDDLKNLRDAGFTNERIRGDYDKAIIQGSTPGGRIDPAAVDRFKRMVGDQRAIESLNDLLRSAGAQQKGLLDIIRFHTQGQSTLASEVAALNANYAIVLRRINAEATRRGN